MQVQQLIKLTNTVEKIYNKLLVKSLNEIKKADEQAVKQFHATIEEAMALEDAAKRMETRAESLYDLANSDLVASQRKTTSLTNLVQNKLEDLTKTTVEV
jgi:hypothetical protein